MVIAVCCVVLVVWLFTKLATANSDGVVMPKASGTRRGGISVRESGNSCFLGKRYDRLTVLGWQFRMNANWFAVCQCDCGKIVVARAADMQRGAQKSCGCRRNEIVQVSVIINSTTHGETRTRLYRVWRGMLRRCYEPKTDSYQFYGGRGISVCDEWHFYESFSEWSKSHGYQDDLTIDRYPDKDGNYCPSNCRWASKTCQARNRHNNKIVTYRGATKLLVELCEDHGADYNIVRSRLRIGWSIQEAFERPISAKRGKQREQSQEIL